MSHKEHAGAITKKLIMVYLQFHMGKYKNYHYKISC